MDRDSKDTLCRRPILLLLIFFVLCPATLAMARTPPPVPSAVQVVDAEGLIRLAEESEKLLVIDSRIRSDRLQGYIEGAISLPDTKTSCLSLAEVTTDLAQPLLFYCNGIACDRSAKAVIVAHQCGFTRLYWFRGGFKEWKSKRYPYIK